VKSLARCSPKIQMARSEHTTAWCLLLRFLLHLTWCISEQCLLYICTTNITRLCFLQYLTSYCNNKQFCVATAQETWIWEPSSSRLCCNPDGLYSLSRASITHQMPAADHGPQPPPSTSLPIHNKIYLTVLTIHSILTLIDDEMIRRRKVYPCLLSYIMMAYVGHGGI
jgi:hypothetical protein